MRQALFQEIEQKTRQMDPTSRGAYTLLKEAFNKKLNTIISDSDNSCEKGDARKCDDARKGRVASPTELGRPGQSFLRRKDLSWDRRDEETPAV